MEEKTKGKRLTKKQATVLLIVGILIGFGYRFLGDRAGFLSLTFGAMAELVAIYALISLFTKNGLRWR
ncbi:hypothetical protein KKE99_00600 [Patescibacteria group bacterium]|nr:hypothetical protein [Patescibacteria group bacterium]